MPISMLNSEIKMVITDLDGTLLNSKGRVSQVDYNSLESIGKESIVRVIASGRSIFSLRKAIPGHFPIDYFICSCGGGVFRWKNQELIMKKSLKASEVKTIADTLIEMKVNFMIQNPIPDNHRFIYYSTSDIYPDFQNRLNFYLGYHRKIILGEVFNEACQIIVILPKDEILFNSLRNMLLEKISTVKIIRSTSPLDKQSIWLEIFPKDVSKGETAKWLATELGFSMEQTVGIGNDYNDIDLLNVTKHSFLVENAPSELKKMNFNIAKSNDENGFTSALEKVMKSDE